MKSVFQSTFIAALFAGCGLVPASVDAQQPNFLFLLSDDQAWSGLSCQMHPDHPRSKSSVIETPNIASLAAQGMRFSEAYSPASVCSPTRISLQTGKSPAQCKWTKAAPSMRADDGFKLIPPVSRRQILDSEVTIAEMLNTAGYASAHYGKWHIGGNGPQSHGYDDGDGDTGNNDAAPHVEPNPVDIFGMGQRAADFMEKNTRAGKPFFIHMSYHALHFPQNATKSLVEKYSKKIPGGNEKQIGRAAISEDLDRGIGELLTKINQLGIEQNTYVIYMSDNGSSTQGILKGGKGGVWEGGIRVPLIIRGPGIAANSWCHQRVVGYDFYRTFCELAGVKQPLPSEIEGGSITHLFSGSTTPVKRPRPELVFHFPHYQGDAPHTALFLDNYKLIKFYEDDSLNLYDIKTDISESRNIASQNPGQTQKMKALMDTYLADFDAELPKPNPNYDPANPPSIKQASEKKKGGGGKQKMTDAPQRPDQGKGGKPRSPILIALDTNRDKELSAAEMSNATEALLMLDKNRNGQLEPDEYSTGNSPAAKTNSGDRQPWILMHAAELDTNGDGIVEYQRELMDEARRVFAGYDKNNDQQITPDESSGRNGGVKSPMGGFVRQHASELDRDGDGGISKTELANEFSKFFRRADTNGDQRLTPDETGIAKP